MKEQEIKRLVKEGYGRIAERRTSCCPAVSSCPGSPDPTLEIGKRLGYSEEELRAVPEGANLGLGCGNPVALASLKEGETVLDLGSGAGLDCFLAATRVGRTGRVIGVDMTPQMIAKARENAQKGNYENVEFRLGEIENLPVADGSVDVVISNCVINLVPDKEKAFREAFRVLRPGGRMVISDIVLLRELPEALKNSVKAYIGCLAGAIGKEEYIGAIEAAGFRDIKIIDETPFPIEYLAGGPAVKAGGRARLSPESLKGLAGSVVSIKISAVKPGEKAGTGR